MSISTVVQCRQHRLHSKEGIYLLSGPDLFWPENLFFIVCKITLGLKFSENPYFYDYFSKLLIHLKNSQYRVIT